MTQPTATPASAAPPVPHSFLEYLRSFGPGIVIVLTWLGAGDVVDMGVGRRELRLLADVGVRGRDVLAVPVRVADRALSPVQPARRERDRRAVRLHPLYAPVLLFAVVVMGHVYGAYMAVGIGEVCRNVFGFGAIWQWATAWNLFALYLVFGSSYGPLETLFMFFLALLSVSFIGCAIWVGFEPREVARGLFRVEMPDAQGAYNPWLVALAMIGAVGGSLMNLAYPYFLDAKGWRGPQYRRVQMYDFLLGMAAMIVLNLAVWTLGAELLFPDRKIEHLDDLPALVSTVLGEWGRLLFYVGIFAAIYTSILGHATGLGSLGTHAWLRWRGGAAPIGRDFSGHPCYRWIVISTVIPPLVWTLPGMPDFVTLTLVANGAQVILCRCSRAACGGSPPARAIGDTASARGRTR